jgi:hypothetical protein
MAKRKHVMRPWSQLPGLGTEDERTWQVGGWPPDRRVIASVRSVPVRAGRKAKHPMLVILKQAEGVTPEQIRRAEEAVVEILARMLRDYRASRVAARAAFLRVLATRR